MFVKEKMGSNLLKSFLSKQLTFDGLRSLFLKIDDFSTSFLKNCFTFRINSDVIFFKKFLHAYYYRFECFIDSNRFNCFVRNLRNYNLIKESVKIFTGLFFKL